MSMHGGNNNSNMANHMAKARSRAQGEAQRGLDSMHAGEHFDWDSIQKKDNEITARNENFFTRNGYLLAAIGAVIIIGLCIAAFSGAFGSGI